MGLDSEQNNTTPKPLMRDFWSKYRMRMYVIVTAVQCAFVLVVFGLMWATGIIHLDWMAFILISLLSAALLNIMTIPLIYAQSRQFRDLVHAVVHISNEPNAVKPPNPNSYESRHDGFKEILQTIYERGVDKAEADKKEEKEPTRGEEIEDGVVNMASGLAIFNGKDELVYANPRAPIRTDSKTKKETLDLIFPDDDSLETWIADVRENEIRAEREWTRISNKLPGEKERHIYDIAVSYHKDRRAEVVVTLFDRTTLYTPEEDELDFISFAAHELRGPITVIRGYLDVISDELDNELSDDQKELMSRLIVSASRLSSYVNNILNASRYDRKHLKLHLSEAKMRDIYNTISDDMQLRASAQNRILVAEIPKSLPTVAADPNAVGEVLSNLIDNAIKYSNEGGLVHVTAKATPGFVEVSVIDRGIGMPESVVRNLFHKFYRSHRSRETVAGTGIGLYISKAIIGSHGGTIQARSIENDGSTFSFTLPIYDTVAEKLKSSDNSNEALIEHGSGWIRNHSMYRG